MSNAPPPAEAPSSNPFPEYQFPVWIWRQMRLAAQKTKVAVRAPPYKELASFSYDLKTCCRSGADLPRGLELCLKSIRRTPLGSRWQSAPDQLRRGSTLTDALRVGEDLLPPFFLPVIQAGELSGRLDDALEFLEAHCRLLAGPAAALRNLWFFPLVILMAGSVIRVLIALGSGAVTMAITFFFQSLFAWGQLAVILFIVFFTPVKYFVDQVRLAMPWTGELEREIAVHRFFRVMALLYSVGGIRVETMIRTSAKTVSNQAARIDFLKAAKAIEEKATIPEAFRRVSLLSENERTSIDVGDMSGTLEAAFDQISSDTGSSLLAKVNIVQPILVRIVLGVVIFSLASSMLTLAMAGS